MPMTSAERDAIIHLLAEGLDSEQVAHELGIPKMRVAAVRAHITMGRNSTFGHGLTPVELEEAVADADLKFGLEKDMQAALRRNIHQLDPALEIIDDGKERHVESGYIDILAKDAEDRLVVIELKAGTATDAAVTQVLSYVGSLQAEQDQPVIAILIARGFSTRQRLAARTAGVKLLTYGFTLKFVEH